MNKAAKTLIFIHEQMVDLHGEDPEQPYMIYPREIIAYLADDIKLLKDTQDD